MNPVLDAFSYALGQAQLALSKGNRREARHWAEKAAALDPQREEPWLILASIASPRASLAYLNHALEINPGSLRARKGMHWAISRLRTSTESEPASPKPLISQPIASDALIRSRPAILPWALAAILLIVCALVWFGSPTFSSAFSKDNPVSIAQIKVEKSTYTPTVTATFTASPTFTPTHTLPPTPTKKPTALPTSTPTIAPTATETLPPTPKPTRRPKPTQAPQLGRRPPGVGADEHWVDVDLSSQYAYAMQGDTLVRSFLVSTGTWLHPTVTGTFYVYVKYRFANMTGPGYFLPNVPYVMYFYKGYGLHGTYWHHNFGHPMSHGCVNLATSDAAWLFINWVSVGTVVNVHN
jgi:lipoprotein-anchoring transpeptidase ErfK/SrfK